jgi:hypothetical protein
VAFPPARSRSRLLLLGLLLLLLLVGTAASSSAASTGTLKAQVQYPDIGGAFHPLANVEVFLWAGGPHNLCTDASGIATFTGIPAGGGYSVVAGVSVSSLHCTNGEFLKPGTALKPHNVKQSGITLAAGQTKTVVLKTGWPPADQTQVCGGEVPTIVGTAAHDVLVGTAGNDIVSGGRGSDTIRGLGGDD